MIKAAPQASIIVPMRDAEQFVSETLRSILSERDTTFEAVVIDDNSTDHSAELVLGFNDERIRLIGSSGRGPAAARNTGLAACCGTILMFCDADDLYPPARISQQVQWLNHHPEFDGVCGTFSMMDHGAHLIAKMSCGDEPVEITSELLGGKLRTHLCTYAIRSSLIVKVGGFREFFDSAQDLDFQLRLGEAGRIAYVPQNWYFYRIHASSITHRQPNTTRLFFERKAYELHKQRREFGLDDLQRGLVPLKPADDQSTPNSARRHMQGLLLWRAWQEHRAGKKWQALRTVVRAILAEPLQIHVWRNALALIVKPSLAAAPQGDCK